MSNSTKVLVTVSITLMVVAILTAQLWALTQFVQYVTATPASVEQPASANYLVPHSVDYGCSVVNGVKVCTSVEYNPVSTPTYEPVECPTCKVEVQSQTIIENR